MRHARARISVSRPCLVTGKPEFEVAGAYKVQARPNLGYNKNRVSRDHIFDGANYIEEQHIYSTLNAGLLGTTRRTNKLFFILFVCGSLVVVFPCK